MAQERLEAVREDLEERAERVRARISAAAARAARDPARVEVLPVTKGHPPERLRQVAGLGFRALAENRVGEAEEKREQLGDLGLRWHMVGHLQRNKARRAVRLFDEVESVDSLRLARKLSRELEKEGRKRLPALVQVNTSGEEAKGGFLSVDDGSEAEALEKIRTVCGLPRLDVRGLMTMAPLTDDEEVLRTAFRRMRRLFQRCGAEVEGFEARTLSMGMSNDFEIAVEEGSTRVRLGTVLLGERQT